MIARYFVDALNWLVRRVVNAVIGAEVQEVRSKMGLRGRLNVSDSAYVSDSA
jgi:hypothetical protein